MRDKRPVDELSIEELERILAIRRREARLSKIRGRDTAYSGRRIGAGPDIAENIPPNNSAVVDSPTDVSSDDSQPEFVAAVPKDYYQGSPEFEDELDQRISRRERGIRETSTVQLKKLWNRALTLVEIAAAVGLIFIFISLYQSFQEISQRTAGLQADFAATQRAQLVPPSPTPVINIAAVVLPSGHIYKNGEAELNLDEVPAQYRDQYAVYAAQLPAVRPTPSIEGPIRVQIPKIGVDSPVVTGDDPEALKLGVGHHIGSTNPGQFGNMVLSGHNDVYGEIFRHLDELAPGDEIIVSTRTRDYTYVVQPQQDRGQLKGFTTVYPTDVWVMDSNNSIKQLTLLSCYPYRVDTRRIIIFATLKEG